MKHELQNILSGKSQVEFGATIQAVSSYLRKGKSSSEMAQGSIDFKKQEESYLEQFAYQNYFIDSKKLIEEHIEFETKEFEVMFGFKKNKTYWFKHFDALVFIAIGEKSVLLK